MKELDARAIISVVCDKHGGRPDMAQGALRDGLKPEDVAPMIRTYLEGLSLEADIERA